MMNVSSTINTEAIHVRSTQLIRHDIAHYIYEETSFATSPDVILEIIYKKVDPVLTNV